MPLYLIFFLKFGLNIWIVEISPGQIIMEFQTIFKFYILYYVNCKCHVVKFMRSRYLFSLAIGSVAMKTLSLFFRLTRLLAEVIAKFRTLKKSAHLVLIQEQQII